MSFRSPRRIIVAVIALSMLGVIGFGRFGSSSSFAEQAARLLSSNPEPVAPAGVAAMAVTAPTKTDAFIGGDGDGKADPGETIEYTVTIPNGPADAANVNFTDTIDANTSIVPGSLATSPIGIDDTFPATVIVNVSINSAALAVPFSVTTNDYFGVNHSGLTISAFDATTANGGQIAMTTSGAGIGQFTYNPPAGFTGTDTFSYTLADNTNAPNPVGSRTATVSIPVSGMVWFIQNGAALCTSAANDCGRLSNPYSSLADFQAENGDADVPASDQFFPAAGDNIFLYESASAYLGGVTLLANQKLIGQDSTSSLSTITGLTPPTGSPSFPGMNTGGNATTIQNVAGNGVTLSTSNTLNGFTAGNSSASAISGTSFVNVNVADVIVNSTGQALSLATGASGAGGVNFTSVSSSGGTNCVNLTFLAGTFNLGGGAMNNGAAGGNCFVVGGAAGSSGGNVVVNYLGTITRTSGNRVVSVENKTGGSVNFTGAISGSGTNNGVRLDTNSTATVNFMGGLVMSTSGNTAFSATGGGIVNVCDENPCNPAATGGLVNTLTTTTGTALNVANTTIGANRIEFRSISSNGAPNGIFLQNTGVSGGLTVTGNSAGLCGGISNPTGSATAPVAADCTGGTIQNSTGADGATAGIGIYLNNTRNVSLTRI